jgi:hypothetical protein
MSHVRDKEVETSEVEDVLGEHPASILKYQQSQHQLNSHKFSIKQTAQQKLVQKKISENDLKIIRAFTSNTHHVERPGNSRAQMMRRRVILGNIYSQFNTTGKRGGGVTNQEGNSNPTLSVLAQSSPIPYTPTSISTNPSNSATNSTNNLKSDIGTKISDVRIAGSNVNLNNEQASKKASRPPFKPRNSYAVTSRASIVNRN